MAGEDVANDGGAREGLVDLHRRASRIGEDGGHALALEGLHEDVRSLSRLVGSKSGNESFRSNGRFLNFGGDCFGGIRDAEGGGAAGRGVTLGNAVEGNGKPGNEGFGRERRRGFGEGGGGSCSGGGGGSGSGGGSGCHCGKLRGGYVEK